MELKKIKQHIDTLVKLEETEAPVISLYLNIEKGDKSYRWYIENRIKYIKKTLSNDNKINFMKAYQKIDNYLFVKTEKSSKGVIIFSREGKTPFFLALQFKIPLPNMMRVEPKPHIYHLVEAIDTYHHYVMVLLTENSARILEINLGQVTTEILSKQPELQIRTDRTLTKEQYYHHREQQTEEFIKEKVKILDKLMSTGGHTHLFLAGNPKMTQHFQQVLPKHLAAKLVHIMDTNTRETTDDVVLATIAAFVEKEEMESLAVVDRLIREIRVDGLAVVGANASLMALNLGQVDVLVLSKSFDPHFETKENMVKVAEQIGCKIEIVNHSVELERMGGVGCLLRYKLEQIELYK